MNLDKSWVKPVALAMSLPSSILTLGYGAHILVEKKILTRTVAFTIFLAIIINSLLLMVFYAVKKKNKSN